MTVQPRPRTQLPALQLLPFFWSVFPTPNAQGWMLGRGGEDVCS